MLQICNAQGSKIQNVFLMSMAKAIQSQAIYIIIEREVSLYVVLKN